MIYRVCGRAGSGKTEYMLGVLGDIMNSGGEAVVIVPEQQSLDYERTVLTRFGGGVNLRCEILNFERLPNRTYREYGGLNRSHVDSAGRDLVMAIAVDNVGDKLSAYKKAVYDIDFIKSVAEEAVLMKQNGVLASDLLNVSDRLPPSLAAKTHDISLMTAEYDRLLKEIGSDSADVLSAYADILDTMPFFEGKTVIIDSFYSFTVQEHRIIDAIERQANGVYISFLYDGDDKSGVFDDVKGSYLRVSRFSDVKDIILADNRRTKKESLAFAERRIWKTTKETFDICDGAVEFVSCKSSFEECEAAAASVVEMLSCGMRMRDIAVVAGNTREYDGIIDAVLKKHGINAFLSSKDELAVKPLPMFITSAVRACVDGFSLPSVKKYIKSGCTGLSSGASRLLLRYADTWGIRGKAWINDEPWLANPDGYIESATSRQMRELAEVNDAKNVVSAQLSALYECFSGDEKSCLDYCKALYTHLISCGTDKMTAKNAAACRACGDEDGAAKMTQLWESTMSVLEQLCVVCGERMMTAERFLFLLELALSEYKVGTIPLYADAVTVGDASMIRLDNAKAVILLGVNDGVFPRSATVDGLFGNDDLLKLEEFGINMGDTSKKRRAKEKLWFYTAFSGASDRITVIYNDARPSRPSVAALKLMRLFPNAKKRVFGEVFSDKAFSPVAAAENIRLMPQSVKDELDVRGLNLLEFARTAPLADSSAVISHGGNQLTLTPSRLEKYTYCAFSYFGRYVLKLTQNKKATFDYPEIGTFVHRILELFVASRVINGAFERPDDAEIRDSVEKMTDEYILSVCKGSGDRRFKYICTRLKNTLFLLLRNICDELAESSFVPVAFEKKLSGDETVVYSPDGVRVNICGTVDRVDEFKKGKTTYLRVVDYKTGSTVFSKKALREGLGLQMFLYMFSLCKKEGKKPAGVLYVPASLAPGRENTPEDAADTDAFVKKRFRRSGLLLADYDIVDAMEKGIGGVYLPAKLKKDDTFDYRSSVATAEQLGKLKLSVEGYIGKLADELVGGNMCVSPLKADNDHNACRFCDMKTVCRLSRDNSVARAHSKIQIEVGEDRG